MVKEDLTEKINNTGNQDDQTYIQPPVISIESSKPPSLKKPASAQK